MQHRKVHPSKPEAERAEWVQPALSRLSAGSAELTQGQSDDGQDNS